MMSAIIVTLRAGSRLPTRWTAIVLGALVLSTSACAVAADSTEPVATVVNSAVRQVMEKSGIPGMSIAVITGDRTRLFHYGVASKESGGAVDDGTVFEIGSVSKTFTANLGAFAAVSGAVSLSAPASNYVPALRGSAFDDISMLELATYTAGGLPLQFPDAYDSREAMIGYYQQWQPSDPPGTVRQYSNPSLGLFGHAVAASVNRPFDALMTDYLHAELGSTSTYLEVPPEKQQAYAQGYTRQDVPVRVTPGAMDDETYGIKSTAADLARFVHANMDPADLDEPLREAIAATHVGYYRAGSLIQGLGWEFVEAPVTAASMQSANSPALGFTANTVEPIEPPAAPGANALYNKTGSTNGFGAYIAFVPDRQVGVVLLANKNYPIVQRVALAHTILQAAEAF